MIHYYPHLEMRKLQQKMILKHGLGHRTSNIWSRNPNPSSLNLNCSQTLCYVCNRKTSLTPYSVYSFVSNYCILLFSVMQQKIISVLFEFHKDIVTRPIWTFASTKISGTQKFATTSHNPLPLEYR